MRYIRLSLIAFLSSLSPALAWNSPAPDIVLYCPPALASVAQRLAESYSAASGVEVHIFQAPPAGLIGLIKHRARADVVLADAATIAALARDTLIRPESVVSLGRDPYVLVVNSGTAAVMAQSAAGILATHEVVVPDPTTAASFDGAAVLQAAFPSGVALRLIGVAETGAVVAAVSRDRAVAGLVYRSEAGAPGISMVAALPLPAIAMSGALVINGQSAQAPALLAFINTPAGAAILRDGGLERGL